MKKILSLLFIFIFLFGVLACNDAAPLKEAVTPSASEDDSPMSEYTLAHTHDWTAATCTAPKTCKTCQKTEWAALGHDMKDATCTDPSLCSRCDHREGEALGHTFGDWFISSLPTDSDAWGKSKVCSLCGASESDEMPAEIQLPSKAPSPTYAKNTDTTGSQVKLVSGGKAQFTVVSSDPDYDNLAIQVATELREQLGVSFNSKSSAQQNSVTGKKIVIGKPPRTVFNNVSELSYLGLLCYTNGSTIHITGHIKQTVTAAVNRFTAIDFASYKSTGSDGKTLVSIPTGALTFVANPTNYVTPNPTLLGVPLSDYTVIIPNTIPATENFLIIRLIDELGRYSGVYLPVKTEDKATGEHEIVIGKTALPQSQALYEALGDRTYRMKSENGCIYIAYSDYTITQPTKYAINLLLLSDINEPINISTHSKKDASALVEKSEGADIRVMSSNIVCAADANGIKDIEKPYNISWQERIAIVTNEIMVYLPDFIGFQEIQNGLTNGIQADMFTEILNNVSSEYAFVVYEGMAPSAYWNPIMYRKTVWQIDAQDVLYPGDFDNAMHRWQWALFSKIDDPTEKYIVLNLHNPTGNNQTNQQAAADIVNAKIRELKELYPHIPIILTGDFNASRTSVTYQKTIANTDIRTSSTLTTNYNSLQSIDHVMVSTDTLDVLAYRTINDEYMTLTSDHRPIFVDIARK